MHVIRLDNGNLMVPESALDATGGVLGDAYVEIGPGDPDFARLAEQALSEQEHSDRRRRWEQGDEALRRQFLRHLADLGGPAGGAGDGRGT